ncbi:MAG: SIMPL domain-containing protein [Anaerolineae bacterium]
MSNQHLWPVRIAIIASLLLAGALALTLVNPYLPLAGAEAPGSNTQTSNAGTSPAGLQAETALPRTITVVGEGKVRIKPDIAQINIGIEIIGDTVKDASSQAAATMDTVIATLLAQGIEEKDIQTSGYSVWVERPYGPEGPMGDTLYHVNNTVMVTIRDLDKVGAILDATIEAGANNIYGVSFSVADPNPLMSQARERAVADARAKAEELAGLNNVTIGEVISVSEVIGGMGGYYTGGFRAALPMAEGMGSGGGPISPGELEMTTQLQVTYAIQ